MSKLVCIIEHPVTKKKAMIYKSALNSVDKYYVTTGPISVFDVPFAVSFVTGLLSAQLKALELLGVEDERE